MTHSSLTNGIQLTSDSSPRGSRVDRFIVHHAATTSLAAILSLFQPGGRQVSANYALGNDGTLVLAVDEDRRAWTSSSAHWDGRAVTIEVANSVAGGSWPVSDVSFDKLARLIADVSLRHGFPINDDTVLTHQELYIRYGDSYATACPGDLQRRKGELLALANHYRAGGGGTPGKPKEIKVKLYHVEDRRTSVLEPGDNVVSKNAKGAPQHVLGTPGPYSITPHVYAECEPGDALDVTLEWFTAGRFSPHYVERLVADENGLIRASVEFKRALAANQSVVLRVTAPTTNKGPVTVSLLDCDSFLFTAA